MITQLPKLMTVKFRLGALTGVAVLLTVLGESQALSAPLAGASRQLEPDPVVRDLLHVGGLKYRDHRAVDRHGYHHFRFRYAGNFPYYRYTVFEEEYDSPDYFPPQPHYFSHRYNWYPPLATFRKADPLWYAW
jgi:hypothetical protein